MEPRCALELGWWQNQWHGIDLLELICMDFLRGSGRRNELISIQEPKVKGVEDGGRDGVASMSQLSVIPRHYERP